MGNTQPPGALKILLVEDNPGDVRMVRDALGNGPDARFDLAVVERLKDASDRLGRESFDAILLDPHLPDSEGLNSIVSIVERAPNTPVVVLTALQDDELALAALRKGAVDYLVKDDVTGRSLVRVLRYAVERQKMVGELQETAGQLQAAKNDFATIIDRNADAVIVVDGNGTTRFANPAAETLFGRKRADLVGLQFGFPLVGGETSELEIIRPGSDIAYAEMRVVGTKWAGGDALLASLRDITERKRAEQALRESEARFRAVIDNSPAKIHINDLDGRYTLINRHSEVLFGVTDKEARGKTSFEIFPKEVADSFTGHDQRVIESGQTIEEEEEWVSDDGLRTYLTVKFPILDPDGEMVAVGAIGTDITERKRMELELAKRAVSAHERLAAAIDGLPDMICLDDADDRLVMCNEGYRKLNQAAAEALKPGTRFEDRMRAFMRAGLIPESVGREEDWLRERMEQHRNPGAPLELLRQDGQWLLIREHRLADGGTLSMRTDITERKRSEEALRGSEERFRTLIDGSSQGILVHRKLRTLYVNQSLVEMFGYDSADEILALESREVMTAPEERARLLGYHQARLRGDPAPVDYEYKGLRKDGSKIWLENRSFQIEWEGGPAICTTLFDITDRKSTEAQLRQAQKMEAVGQLTGGVAHDFNNLLAVILGNLQLIERRLGDDERQRKRVQTAIHATLRGAELIKRLLAFSRRQVLEPKNVDLNELVSGTTELWRRTLGERIEIDLRLSGDLEPTHIDPGQLENALLNLAVNARDAMPGGGRLTIETATIDVDERYAAGHPGMSSSRYVLLTVADTGTGMPPDVLKHVFEPFYTTKEVGKGTGLGLSMVYGFAKQSGAYIDIRSEEGRGTTVDLYLPVVESADGAAPERAATADACPGGGETILVVEDEADVRETAVALLEDLGYRVLEAENGPAALALVDGRDDIDLLFTDIVMPGGMDGFELGREVRQRSPGIPVLYASGYAEQARNGHERPDGDGQLIGKPYQNEELARWVRSALDGCAK